MKNTFIIMIKKIIFIVTAFVIVVTAFRCQNNPSQEAMKTGDPLIDGLSERIAKNPQSDSLLVSRAAAFYKKGLYDEAIKDIAGAMKIDSINPNYHHILADIYLDNNDSRMALRTMERVVTLHPERIISLLKLSEFQLIVRQNEASIKTLNRILEIDPQNAEAFFMLGQNLTELKQTDRAIAAYKQATAADGELIDGWVNLGILLDEKKDKKAIDYFETALRIDSSSEAALHGKGMYYQNRNQLKDALAAYKKIPVFHKNSADAYYNIGLLYMDMDSIQAAKTNFNIAVNVDPQYALGYYFRGVATEKLGDLQNAKKDYQTTLNLAPNYKAAQDALEKVSIKIK